MSLHGSLRGSIFSRGVSGGGGSASAPLNPPTILSFTLDDMTLDTGVAGTFSWTKSGTQTGATLDPGDGTTPYTLTTQSSYAHTYDGEGVYDATLTLTGPGGTSSPATINDIAVTAPVSVSDWHDWAADFTEISATNRNLSGSDKTAAPFTSLLTFHPGEVLTTHWFDADVDGTPLASNAWQLGQRTTHPDGSLASAILRAIIPGTWTNETDKQVTLTRKLGSWPAETDGRSLSTVTGASDYIVELDDITRPENRPDHDVPSPRNAQAAWTNPTLEYDNNRALGLSTARNVTAGNVFRQEMSYEALRTPDGSTADTDLWVLNFTDTWYSPGTDTVIHQAQHTLLCHGYANAYVLAKCAKIRLLDGVTELHNYSDVLNLTMADWNNRSGVGEWDFTDASTDFTTFRFRVGDAVKIEGDTPSNIPDGHLFQVTKTQDMGDWAGSGRAGELTQLPYLGLAWQGVWSSRGGNGAGQFNNMPPGSGGGSHTMTSYVLMLDKHIFCLRDDDGCEIWTVGGAVIEPAWTRAEKIRRMQTGQIPSIPIEEFPENSSSPYLGLASNAPKNTDGIPAYTHLHSFGPGRTLYHRGDLSTGGVYFQAGNHLNECSLPMWNTINDMANPDAPFWHMQKIAAAESICIIPINCFDHNTVGGNKIAAPFVLNNGPDNDGVAYTGLGPCQPTAAYGTVRKASGSGTGNDQQNEMSYYPTLGISGSHSTKEMAFGYVLRCFPTDLVGIQQLWSLVHSQYLDNAAPLYGRNKTHNSINYYSAGMLGTGTWTSGQVRSWIGWNFFLSFCLYTPDSDPLSPYFRDVANTSIDYFDAVIQDPAIMGSRALKVGPMQSLNSGGNQFWILGRHSTAATYLLKRSGRTGAGPERILRYITALPRALWGAPEGGGTPWMQATGDGYTGYTGFVFAGRMFDKANDVSDPASSDPLATIVRFLDDASSVTDGSNIVLGLESASNATIVMTASTSSTVTFATLNNAATHQPAEGDSIIFSRDPVESSHWPPTELVSGIRYWLYDVSGSTCKLSSTPGPSFTQVTWSLASTKNIHRNCVSLDFATRRPGAVGPNGLLGIMQNTSPAQVSLEYLYEAWGSVPCANTMFGATYTEDAIALHDIFRTRVKNVAQGSHDYHNRAWNNGSWAVFEHYGPGAT